MLPNSGSGTPVAHPVVALLPEGRGRSSGLPQSWSNIKNPCQYHSGPGAGGALTPPTAIPSLSPHCLQFRL